MATLKMAPSQPLGPILILEEDEHSPRWWHWLILLLLALAIHALVFLARVPWLANPVPQRMQVQTISPKQLEQIRRHWERKDHPMGLIKPNANTPRAQEAPDNARYMSDRNIRVAKEQKARDSEGVPKVGAPGLPDHARTRSSPVRSHPAHAHPNTLAHPKASTHVMPKLGNLGIPFHLDQPPPDPATAQREPDPESQQSEPRSGGGGQGSILDKDVPEGSENILNAKESIYYSFFSRVYDAMYPVWASLAREGAIIAHPRPGDYITDIDVVLDREGNLIQLNVLSSSGVQELDHAAEETWRKVARFPNPPAGLLDSNGQIHMPWRHDFRVMGGGVEFMPPEQVGY